MKVSHIKTCEWHFDIRPDDKDDWQDTQKPYSSLVLRPDNVRWTRSTKVHVPGLSRSYINVSGLRVLKHGDLGQRIEAMFYGLDRGEPEWLRKVIEHGEATVNFEDR